MGAYVLLRKEHEDESVVIYRFGPSERQMGRIQLDKSTEMFSELDPVPGVPSSRFYFDRAAQLMARWYTAGEGFPERGSFAAG